MLPARFSEQVSSEIGCLSRDVILLLDLLGDRGPASPHLLSTSLEQTRSYLLLHLTVVQPNCPPVSIEDSQVEPLVMAVLAVCVDDVFAKLVLQRMATLLVLQRMATLPSSGSAWLSSFYLRAYGC